MNKFLAFCLATAGLASLPLTAASAHAAPACVATAPATTPVNALPATAHIDVTVFVGVHRHHRHYRTVRRVYYRHGYRHVVYRRVYY